jgi:hypothetical protein
MSLSKDDLLDIQDYIRILDKMVDYGTVTMLDIEQRRGGLTQDDTLPTHHKILEVLTKNLQKALDSGDPQQVVDGLKHMYDKRDEYTEAYEEVKSALSKRSSWGEELQKAQDSGKACISHVKGPAGFLPIDKALEKLLRIGEGLSGEITSVDQIKASSAKNRSDTPER